MATASLSVAMSSNGCGPAGGHSAAATGESFSPPPSAPTAETTVPLLTLPVTAVVKAEQSPEHPKMTQVLHSTDGALEAPS